MNPLLSDPSSQVRSQLGVHEELLADGAHHADHVVAGLHPRHVLLDEEGDSVGLRKVN